MMVAVWAMVHDAHSSVLRVDADAVAAAPDGSSWATAYSSLQDAIAAGVGDELWVAQGTYGPKTSGSNACVLLIPEGVTLYGGFSGDEMEAAARDPLAHPTILTGDYLNNDSLPLNETESRSDNAPHVVRINQGTLPVVLDGLAIRGGCADGSDPDDRGGGLMVVSGAASISNCVLTMNTAASSGGAVACTGGTLSLTNCRIEQNLSGAGGAVFSVGSGITMSRCFVINNQAGLGGGAYVSSGTTLTATNCVFAGNVAFAADGGALYNSFNARVDLLNCTLCLNRAGTGGGALCNWNAEATVVNCVLWDDQPDEVFNYSDSTCSVLMSIVADG
jgi:predicted outer membrane repeat protein